MASAWPFEACYTAFDYTCRVRSDLRGLGDLVDRLLRPFRTGDANGVPTFTMTSTGGAPGPYLLKLDGQEIQKPESTGSMIDLIISELTVGAVERTDKHVVIHAGSVARDDSGIVFPAPPDSGKTTLTVGLTNAGFAFFTDEAALIDRASGFLHPFLRPAAMDPDAIDLIPGLLERLPSTYLEHMRHRIHLTPDDMGGPVGRPCPIRFVIAPMYRRGQPTELIPMSKPESVMTLAKNSFNIERIGGATLDVLKGVVEDADCFRLFIGDLDDAIQTIGELVDGR